MPGSTKKPEKSGYYGTGTGTYTHADFTYIRRKRRGGHAVGGNEVDELNIVPYLDIMVNLIIFMLVVQATLVSLGLINVSAPSYAAIAAGGPSNPDEVKQDLRLTVGIARDGFYIAARGGVLPGEDDSASGEMTPDGVDRRRPSIPMLPNGKYNFRGLKIRQSSPRTG